MKVLHLSDLHVTREGETLRSLWRSAEIALGDERFDFIVISGDLSQAADEKEYPAVLEFIRADLIPRLHRPDVARVVVVPGNHDVDWSKEIGTICPSDRTLPDKWLKALRSAPERSRLRLDFERGQPKVRDIGADGSDDEEVAPTYFTRFANVQQAFFDALYRDLGPQHRRFDLLTGRDWSLHRFDEERVAFFGINSCTRNDRHWTGACLSQKALTELADLARTIVREWNEEGIFAGVWHHGLASAKGQSDHLSPDEIGRLYNAGIRVGFHGHVHEDASRVVRLLQHHLTIVATGSLGAGSSDLPEGVTNQFSVAEVNSRYVRIQRYERAPKEGAYVKRASRLLSVREQHEPPEIVETGTVERVRQRWLVNEQGIATIDLELSGLRNPGGLVLAVAGTPIGKIDAEIEAELGGQTIPVAARPLGAGRVAYRLPQDLEAAYDRCKWRMRLSNAVALSQADLAVFGLSARRSTTRFDNCPKDSDQIGYTVRFPVEHLTLELEFADRSALPGDVRVFVEEKREARDGSSSWRLDREAAERCAVERSGGTFSSLCAHPEVGQRYSLVFRPAASREALSRDMSDLSAALVKRVIGTRAPSTKRDIVAFLSLAVRRALIDWAMEFARCEGRLGREALQECEWIGYLWDSATTQLHPAFGDFRRQRWNASLAAGETAAGHAFRFARLSGWHVNHAASRVLMTREDRTRRGQDNRSTFAWNLSVPLFTEPNGRKALGVVAFYGRDLQRPLSAAEKYLERIALRCDPLAALPEDDEVMREKLTSALNTAFWHTLSERADHASGVDEEWAALLVRALGGVRDVHPPRVSSGGAGRA